MEAKWISFFCFSLAALLHYVFFFFEAVLLQKPEAARRMKLSEEAHKHVKLWALNQAFYNLALALGMTVGLIFVLQLRVVAAGTLVGFCGLSMILAGIVLAVTAPRYWKGALAQALPPALGFLFLVSHISPFLGGAG